jgi:hypothetical protein
LRRPANSREQFEVEFLLQVRNGLADGGLRDVKMTRSLAIALPLHYRREVSKMSQLHE